MYDSVLRYVDSQIGRIVNYLEQQNIREETAIIVTADHGEALHDRGIYGHAAGNEQRLYESDRDYLYRELLDVPLVVDIPNESGRDIFSPFSLLWIHQIIADIIGSNDGGFPQRAKYSDRIFDTESVVLADTITEHGHTITAISDDTKVITNGMKGDSMQREDWHVLSHRDRSDQVKLGSLPDRIADEITNHFTDPDSLRQSENEIQDETMEQLASLRYR